MWRGSGILALVLLMCVPAASQVTQVRCRQLQTVPQQCNRGRCVPPKTVTVDCFASGLVIGKLRTGDLAVLTVAHLIKGKYQSIGVSVAGQWHAATLRAWHLGTEYGDLAVVSFPYSGTYKAIQIADRPVDGSAVDIYVHTGKAGTSWRARTADYHEISRSSEGYSVLSSISIDIPPQCETGWSGAGVVCRGKLVGVIDSGGRSVMKSYGTSGQLIRAFLLDTLGYVPGDVAPKPPRPPLPPDDTDEPEEDSKLAARLAKELAALKRQYAIMATPRDFVPAYEQVVEVAGAQHLIR